MAEEVVLSVRAMIFIADIDLLKGLITEHGIEVDDLEIVTKTQAVTRADTWFIGQVKDKDKGLTAIHSVMETLEKSPAVASLATGGDSTPTFSPFQKDLKISGQVVCKTGISYTSLRRQIENAKEMKLTLSTQLSRRYHLHRV